MDEQKYEVDKKKIFYADMALIIGAMLWGMEYIAIKYALLEFSPIYVNVFRFGFGFIAVGLVFWKKAKQLDKSYVKVGLVIGFFSFVAFACMTSAMQYISVAVNAFLVATYTVWVPLITTIIYKKRPHWTVMTGSLLCMIGIYFLTLVEGEIHIGFGEALSLSASILFSFVIIIKAHYIKKMDPIGIAISQTGGTGLYYIIAAIAFEPLPVYTGHTESILAIIYIVIGATAVAHVIVNMSLRYTTATRQVIIISLESVFAAIFGFLILKESLTLSVLWGTLLIFSAIILIETELKFIPYFRKKSMN